MNETAGELDEYPTTECDHCGLGACHFATETRCIVTCIYGNEKECPSGVHKDNWAV